jgi:hypothetical protein
MRTSQPSELAVPAGLRAPLTDLTPRMYALVIAMERIGGGAQESDVQKEALMFERATLLPDRDRPERSIHDWYSGAMDGLLTRGAVERVKVGRSTQFWLTQEAWTALDHADPVPRPPQENLF